MALSDFFTSSVSPLASGSLRKESALRELNDITYSEARTAGPGFAEDDSITVSSDMLDGYGASWFRIGEGNNHTDLLENDPGADTILYVNGSPILPGAWFDGDGGGQFRVFPGGVVDFRNRGEKVSDGDSTGFTYTASDGSAQDTAIVTLTIDPDADFAQNDWFSVEQSTLDAAGTAWVRLGDVSDDTDLLENDPGAETILYVNGRAIKPGIWFEGDGGGLFRVFPGGVVDFQNRGEKVSAGDSTGFTYTAYDGSALDTATVSVAVETDQLQTLIAYDDGLGQFQIGEATVFQYGYNPNIAELSNGQVVATYGRVLASVLNPGGGEAVAEFPVVSPFPLLVPDVAPLSENRFVIVSAFEERVIIRDYGITAQIFAADGAPVEPDIRVKDADSDSFRPAVATLPTGQFVVVWENGQGSMGVRIFESDGTPVSDAFLINDIEPLLPAVTALENGQFVVTWTSWYGVILAQVFNADGLPASEEIFLAEGLVPYGGPNASGVPVALDGGNFAIVWGYETGIEPDYAKQIKMKLFTENGVAASPDLDVSQNLTESHGGPSAVAFGDDKIAIAWTTTTEGRGPDDQRVSARLFDFDGTPLGDTFQVNNPYLWNAGSDVIALSNGGFMIAWARSDGTHLAAPFLSEYERSIAARIFDADGQPTAPFFTNENAPLAIAATQLLANDVNPGSAPLSVQAVSAQSELGAVIEWTADGVIIYDPLTSPALDALEDGQRAVDRFDYTMTDESTSDTGTVFVTVYGRSDTEVDVVGTQISVLGDADF